MTKRIDGGPIRRLRNIKEFQCIRTYPHRRCRRAAAQGGTLACSETLRIIIRILLLSPSGRDLARAAATVIERYCPDLSLMLKGAGSGRAERQPKTEL